MKLLIGLQKPKKKKKYIRSCLIIYDLYVYTDIYVFKYFSTVYNILNLVT